MTPYWIPPISRMILPLGLLLLACIPASYGDDEPKSGGDEAAKTVQVAGTFEAIRQFEVTPGNKRLTELKIERIVPHGAIVTKGQTLVWFETEDLDQKIREAETDLALAKLAIDSDQFDHAQFLKQQALDKEKARRTRDIAQQEHDNYQKTDRDRTIKSAQFSLKSAEFSLESATEEYRQLEQMYKEDDLTEESEEIVLRRAKRAMETAAFSLERAKIQHQRTIKQTVPRSDASQAETLTRALIDYDKAMQAMASERKKRQLELERKLRKFKEQSEHFAEMRGERKQVILKSEIDGIFLYGKVSRGKLPAKPVELEKGTAVSAQQVIGTVVDPKRLQLRVDLSEEHLAVVRKGATCKVAPKAMPDVKLDGVVKSVMNVPFADGKYDCIVTVSGKQLADVLPAMTCDLIFATNADKQAEGKKPAEKKPAEKKPAEKKPVEKKPTEKKPAEKKPAEKKPAEKKDVKSKATAQEGEQKK